MKQRQRKHGAQSTTIKAYAPLAKAPAVIPTPEKAPRVSPPVRVVSEPAQAKPKVLLNKGYSAYRAISAAAGGDGGGDVDGPKSKARTFIPDTSGEEFPPPVIVKAPAFEPPRIGIAKPPLQAVTTNQPQVKIGTAQPHVSSQANAVITIKPKDRFVQSTATASKGKVGRSASPSPALEEEEELSPSKSSVHESIEEISRITLAKEDLHNYSFDELAVESTPTSSPAPRRVPPPKPQERKLEKRTSQPPPQPSATATTATQPPPPRVNPNPSAQPPPPAQKAQPQPRPQPQPQPQPQVHQQFPPPSRKPPPPPSVPAPPPAPAPAPAPAATVATTGGKIPSGSSSSHPVVASSGSTTSTSVSARPTSGSRRSQSLDPSKRGPPPSASRASPDPVVNLRPANYQPYTIEDFKRINQPVNLGPLGYVDTDDKKLGRAARAKMREYSQAVRDVNLVPASAMEGETAGEAPRVIEPPPDPAKELAREKRLKALEFASQKVPKPKGKPWHPKPPGAASHHASGIGIGPSGNLIAVKDHHHRGRGDVYGHGRADSVTAGAGNSAGSVEESELDSRRSVMESTAVRLQDEISVREMQHRMDCEFVSNLKRELKL